MKKVIISLLTVLAVSTVAIGVTSAYFTDQEVVGNNWLFAGKLDFKVTENDIETQKSPFAIYELEPGVWTAEERFRVYNHNSTMPIKYRVTDSKVEVQEPGMYALLDVLVQRYGGGTWNTVYNGALDGLDFHNNNLGENSNHLYRMYFRLDASAGNQYQSKYVKFDLVVDGTQTNNPTGW